MSAVTSQNILRHPAAHPVALSTLLLKRYGANWVDWEAETLERALQQVPGGVSRSSMDKILAMRVMLSNSQFWTEWQVYLWCTMALAGVSPDFQSLQAPTVSQCYNSADIAVRVRPGEIYSDEVSAFIGAVHRHDEVLVPQAPLDFAEVLLDGEPPVDLAAVRRQWGEMMSKQQAPVRQKKSNPEDEQLLRMWDLKVLLMALDREVAAQLKEVSGA